MSLKKKCQDGIINTLFIFDSYDELKIQFKSNNLYNTNDLEKFSFNKLGFEGFPKLITTVRTENLED